MSRTIGVIADTHGLMRPEALAALAGCERILHAGDIGKPSVLEALEEIGPVIAIRGNVDRDAWAERIPETLVLELSGHQVRLLHNIADLDLRSSAKPDVVIFGHSHKAVNECRDGILYFNPGSAGPRRFKLPVTLGLLHLTDGRLVGEIVPLSV